LGDPLIINNRPGRTFFLAAATIILSFALAYFFYQEFTELAYEDGPIEWLGALGFLFASVFLTKKYFDSTSTHFFLFGHKRNLIIILLALIMFVGFGEEISWGQRQLGIETPESIKELNVQGEFNLHNLEIFNRRHKEGGKKTGLAMFLTIEVLFNLFWFTLCIIVPVLNSKMTVAKNLVAKTGFPVPPIWVGGLFLLTYLTFKTCAVLHPGVEGVMIPARGFGELKETFYGLLFGLYSLQQLVKTRVR
jgi:hypothetical protein